jgi:hypothetical protein
VRSRRWLRAVLPPGAVLALITFTLIVHGVEQPDPGAPSFRRRRAGQHVFTARALTDRIWPGFGRLDPHVSPQYRTSQAIRSDDPEQTQPIPIASE